MACELCRLRLGLGQREPLGERRVHDGTFDDTYDGTIGEGAVGHLTVAIDAAKGRALAEARDGQPSVSDSAQRALKGNVADGSCGDGSELASSFCHVAAS
jgi:hypothetical protein